MSIPLTIANISATVVNFSYSQAQDWSRGFYSLGGNYSISAYSYYFLGNCSITLYYLNPQTSTWVQIDQAVATGFNGTSTKTGVLPGYHSYTNPPYINTYAVEFYDAGSAESQSGWCTIQQNGMPRNWGEKLRVTDGTWLDYIGPGYHVITDADITNGRVAAWNTN